MNYIVFDLEWNQPAGGHAFENPRMPFEIIEIGAVKLDSNYNQIDTYSSIIRPRLYKRLQPYIKALLNYDESFLRKGRPFDMVCREFLKWCGEDFIFCSWGSMDLHYFQNNMDYYHMNPYTTPQKYYDIQKIYADLVDKKHAIVKLENAVSTLNIEVDDDKPFHSAVNDAIYTARVFTAMKPKDLADRYSIDVYNHPTSKDTEVLSFHKNYLEHISREFDNKSEAMKDKDLVSLRCYKCNKKAAKKIKWFANTPNTFTGACKCWYHGLQIGKIKFKQTKDGKIFAIKTIAPTSKKEYENIKNRQEELRLKRQQKRHEKKQLESDESITM